MAFDRAASAARRRGSAARLEMMYEVEKRGHTMGNFMRDKSTLVSRNLPAAFCSDGFSSLCTCVLLDIA